MSRTVVDLVVGAGLGFADRGEQPLRGVEGTWRLFACAARTRQAPGAAEGTRARETGAEACERDPAQGVGHKAMLKLTSPKGDLGMDERRIKVTQ